MNILHNSMHNHRTTLTYNRYNLSVSSCCPEDEKNLRLALYST